MIARHETPIDKAEAWAKLAAPLPPSEIQWRIDGRPSQRDGKYFARFVAYIDAQFVRERLDTVMPGDWDLTLELLPPMVSVDGEVVEEPCAFKARLQILGVIREDVGMGRDYKSAATDAFKRAAVRFGIGHELYSIGPNWVRVDGDGKYAKPIEDPGEAYARQRSGAKDGTGHVTAASESHRAPVAAANAAPAGTPASAPTAPAATPAATSAEPSCPKCGGKMWDNRVGKKNPKAPDYKCRQRTCDGVIWPEREPKDAKPRQRGAEPIEYGDMPELDESPY